jgi:hypothetical protein
MDAGSSISTAQERRLLAAARDGDHDAFRRLVEPHCQPKRIFFTPQTAIDVMRGTL